MPTEARYRTLVEEIQDYAIFMLDPQGRVASWNKGAQRVLGYSESEILGQTILRFFTPEDNQSGVPQRKLDSDEPDTRRLLANVLQRSGADVVAASSATEAMTQLSSRSFDILLTDIGMPDQDGYTLLERLRALPSDKGGATPAVALTAYARDLDRARALRAGFSDFIAKPVEPADLVEKLAQVAGRKELTPSPGTPRESRGEGVL